MKTKFEEFITRQSISDFDSLEKLLRQAQMDELINMVKEKRCSLAFLSERLQEYHVWAENIFEKLYQETRFTFAQSMEIIKQKHEINELKREVEKLNNLLNANI